MTRVLPLIALLSVTRMCGGSGPTNPTPVMEARMMNPCVRHAFVVALCLAGAACDVTINSSGGNGTGGAVTPLSPTPTATGTPTPTPGVPTPTGTFRTPDPPAGSFLPLPTYGAQVVNSVTTPLGQPCLEFSFLDAVVDALRARDTRWGYVCGSDCVNTRRDKIAYHATAGPEVSGALGVWLVDVIADSCSATQSRAYFVISFDPLVGWTGRGRF